MANTRQLATRSNFKEAAYEMPRQRHHTPEEMRAALNQMERDRVELLKKIILHPQGFEKIGEWFAPGAMPVYLRKIWESDQREALAAENEIDADEGNDESAEGEEASAVYLPNAPTREQKWQEISTAFQELTAARRQDMPAPDEHYQLGRLGEMLYDLRPRDRHIEAIINDHLLKAPHPGQHRLLAEIARHIRSLRHIKQEIIRRNEGLVRRIVYNRQARKPSSKYLAADMLQDGRMGMMRALEKYNPGVSQFGTYATWWIKQAIGRAEPEESSIRLPVHVFEKVKKFHRVSGILETTLGRAPSDKEIADGMQIEVSKVPKLRAIVKRMHIIELDAPLSAEEGGTSWVDRLEDETAPMPSQQVEHHDLTARLSRVMLETLAPKEEAVLRRRFGLGAAKEETLEEIGTDFGVTRERVRQIESKALRKLKHPAAWRRAGFDYDR